MVVYDDLSAWAESRAQKIARSDRRSAAAQSGRFASHSSAVMP